MARKKKAIPLSVRRSVIERDKGYCRYCGKKGFLHRWKNSKWISIEHELDHVLPESLGGSANEKNLVIACRHCNRTKGNKRLEDTDMRLIPLEEMKWHAGE